MRIVNCLKQNSKYTVFLLLFFFLVACGSDASMVRLKNDSGFNLKTVTFEENLLGDIDDGEVTDYQEYKTIFANAYIQLFINGEEIVRQPFDQVGETPLGEGSFTFIIEAIDLDKRQITLEVVED